MSLPEPRVRATDTCRICHSSLTPILSLGALYLSDFPASPTTRVHPAVPLDLARCVHPHCGLVQLRHTTPRSWLYGQYWYRSGTNESMHAELADIVSEGLNRLTPRSRYTVADIGANDGTLLSHYPAEMERRGIHRISRIAWEPASNLYQACRPHAEVLFPEFFHIERSDWTAQIDLLTSIAMFYDLDDPHQFVGDAATLLHQQGVWVIQQAYLPAMLDATGYDNIVHEHLEYYHLQPLEYLLEDHGLEVFHVEHRAINAGSFRAYVGWRGKHKVQPSVGEMRAEEAERFADIPAVWATFADRVQASILGVQLALEGCRQAGQTVDLLGASTKGNTLLQACKVDATLVRQAWERSPEKWGRHVGVSGIPIVSEEEGRQDPPDVLLTTIWQFRQALLGREQGYLARGGKILFPLPKVEVVEGVGRG